MTLTVDEFLSSGVGGDQVGYLLVWWTTVLLSCFEFCIFLRACLESPLNHLDHPGIN